jgi:hypothetical protein
MKQWHFISLTLCLLCCNSRPPLEDLSGEWEALGYECFEDRDLVEILSIHHEGNQLTAIKVIGDECVRSGDTTWVATVGPDAIVGRIRGRNKHTNEWAELPCKLYLVEGKLYLKMPPYSNIVMERID